MQEALASLTEGEDFVSPTAETGVGSEAPDGYRTIDSEMQNLREALEVLKEDLGTLEEALQRLAEVAAGE